jgi:hypothetical protein
VAISGERLEVSVTFDAAKGYVATVPDLAESITALSLAVLRRRIGAALLSPQHTTARPFSFRGARRPTYAAINKPARRAGHCVPRG